MLCLEAAAAPVTTATVVLSVRLLGLMLFQELVMKVTIVLEVLFIEQMTTIYLTLEPQVVDVTKVTSVPQDLFLKPLVLQENTAQKTTCQL
jgi:hypothetical protein